MNLVRRLDPSRLLNSSELLIYYLYTIYYLLGPVVPIQRVPEYSVKELVRLYKFLHEYLGYYQELILP